MTDADIDWDTMRCDCGSGEKYKHCCGKRRYKKFLESHGSRQKHSISGSQGSDTQISSIG
jgi:hypothetical protein